MRINPSTAKIIAGVVLGLVVIAGLGMVLTPVFLGIGTKAATAMSVSTTDVYNNSTALLNTVADTENDIFTFLPWLGVGLIVLGMVAGKKLDIGL